MSEQKQQVKRPQRYDADVVETYEEDSGHWMIASEADAYMNQQDAALADLQKRHTDYQEEVVRRYRFFSEKISELEAENERLRADLATASIAWNAAKGLSTTTKAEKEP